MKVAVWYNNKDIRIEDSATPKPGPKEILVKVKSCGICGSDIVEWYRLPRAPLIQGHELGGEIVEIGKFVDKFKVGDRVFVAPKVPCMECEYCRNDHHPVCSNVKERLPGGFAEHVLVPESLVMTGTYLLSDNISFDQSTFIEPLACVVRAQKLSNIKEDQIALIMGCGMSGLLHVKAAKANNVKVIATDINKKRLEFARQIGADAVFEASENIEDRLTSEFKKKADVVILCTSAMSAVEQAWSCVDKGGGIVFFAVPGPDKTVFLPINDFWTKEIRILTSYYCGPYDILESINLLESGAIRVDDMITHRLPLMDIKKGFQLVLDGQESIKVIIKPNENIND